MKTHAMCFLFRLFIDIFCPSKKTTIDDCIEQSLKQTNQLAYMKYDPAYHDKFAKIMAKSLCSNNGKLDYFPACHDEFAKIAAKSFLLNRKSATLRD